MPRSMPVKPGQVPTGKPIQGSGTLATGAASLFGRAGGPACLRFDETRADPHETDLARDSIAPATGGNMGGSGKRRVLTGLGPVSVSLVVLVVVGCAQPPASDAQT